LTTYPLISNKDKIVVLYSRLYKGKIRILDYWILSLKYVSDLDVDRSYPELLQAQHH